MLSDVVKFIDLTKLDVVNQYLAIGWKTHQIYTTAPHSDSRDLSVHYVIGWEDSERAPQYPASTI